MASWKEKGVVLDSDDEEDSLDSQGSVHDIVHHELLTQPEEPENDTVPEGNQESDSEDELAKDGYGVGFGRGARPSRKQSTPPESTSKVDGDTLHFSAEPSTRPLSNLDDSETILPARTALGDITEDRSTNTGSLQLLGSSPPKRVFQFPRAIFDFEDDENITENNSRRLKSGEDLSEVEQQLPISNVPDEISRSYVQLSSPLSSPPIPLPNSPPRDEPSLDPPARLFRPRALKQMQPFTCEFRQYTTTLHAAGIKPYRMTFDNDRRRPERDQDKPFEAEEDSQDRPAEVDEDSQMTDFIVPDNVPSSQPRAEPDESEDPFRPLDSDVDVIRSRQEFQNDSNQDSENEDVVMGGTVSSDEDSDDLPDIADIVKKSNKNPTEKSMKRKKPRTYKNNRTLVPKPPQHSGLGHTGNDGSLDIFEFPLSPPITSPAILPETTNRVVSRVGSIASKKSSPFNAMRNVRPELSEVLTPAGSSSERQTGRTVVSLDSDSDDQGQSSSPNSSRSSSPEPEDRIRRVAKRIRGVLPASWLRLDQKTPKAHAHEGRPRERENTTPESTIPQRGVAVPRPARDTSSSTPQNAMFFLGDESDEEEELPRRTAGYHEPEASRYAQSLADTLFDDDAAVEDNAIDRMLPSRKRPSTGSTTRPSKMRRVTSKLFHGNGSGYARQPKITEQFGHVHTPQRSTTAPGRHKSDQQHRRRKHAKKPLVKKFVPPNLSILDVVEPGSQAYKDAPAFIRIASRTARTRRRLGRHSPRRKIIRLDNIDDTNEAQAVLHNWREGTILPNKSLRYSQPVQRSYSSAQNPVLPSSDSRAISTSRHHVTAPRVLTLSRGRQTTLDGIVQTIETDEIPPVRPNVYLPPSRRKIQPLHHRPQAQPAQLETEETDYNRSHPNAGFGTTKKGLDRLFRRLHRGAAVKGDVQLARFLADPDAVGSVADDVGYQVDEPNPVQNVVEVQPPRPIRRRKRSPQHLDAGAQRYRQPSESLPHDNYLASADTSIAPSGAGKLLGLQPYGSRYTHHFDIFPLQFGVFFHESTFIGSGRLFRALNQSTSRQDYWTRRMPCSYNLDAKELRWAEWDEEVSSELGLCFDWISSQLEIGASIAGAPQLMDFILKYVEQHAFFKDVNDLQHFLRRVSDVLDGFLSRNCSPETITDFQPMIEMFSRLLVLLIQLLQMSKQSNCDFTLQRAMETCLQRASDRCTAFLIKLGFNKVRDFYEECQHLASRESGVRQNRYYIEAWVVMMKVVQAAQIPRLSFWDIVNKQLLSMNLEAVDDARVLESMWYNMFSLLPLIEFDDSGIIETGRRHAAAVENWALPQKLMKRVFAMYSSKSRQSAGFNDYMRCLFTRCHHLMLAWGWYQCGPLIGTLFDFFASHDLAHLRNEESFNSPRFLEELDTDPSLLVDADDKCFHIFLKIVATSIQHLQKVKDTKRIQNLVTRLLPNHDRQYPKEQVIHQRDLASLRNHHDLLCTLFWVAPEHSKPITLLRQLVIPERSHKEACLINLRAWSNLSKFLLSTSPIPKEHQLLVDWQHDVFSKLVHQYQTAEEEIRQQHAALSEALRLQHSEQSIREMIDKNKEQVVEEITGHLAVINLQMKNARNMDVAKAVFVAGRSLITSVMGLFGSSPSACDRRALENALQFIEHYLLRAQDYQQSLPFPHSEEREAILLGQTGYLSVFDDKLLKILEKLVEQMLGKKLDGINERLVIVVWAGVCACQARREDFFKNNVTILQSRVSKWISGHDYPPGSATQTQAYAPLFMAVFLQRVSTPVFKRSVGQRNMFLEWLCSMAKPAERFKFEHYWTMSVIRAQQLPTALLRDSNPYLPRHITAIKFWDKTLNTAFDPTDDSKLGLSLLRKDQFMIIEGAIKYISDAHRDTSAVAHNRRTLPQILKALMETLKEHYTWAHQNQSTSSINYQQFVRHLVSSIKTYANHVCTLDPFFTEPGTIYYHLSHDGPNFFVPTMINHGMRISEGVPESRLLHYCWECIKGMAKRQELGNLPGLLIQVMDHDLKSKEVVTGATKTIMTALIPAVIWVAWQQVEGYIIADLFLKVAEEHILMVASVDISMAAEMAMLAIRHIVYGAWGLYASDTPFISRPHLYLLTRIIRFLTSLWSLLSMASISIPELSGLMQHFTNFTKAASAYYEEKQLAPNDARFRGKPPIQQALQMPSFAQYISKEFNDNWKYNRDGKVWVKSGNGMNMKGRASNVSSYSAAGEISVKTMGGEDALEEEGQLLAEVVDKLRVFNELVCGAGEERKRRELERAVMMGLDELGL